MDSIQETRTHYENEGNDLEKPKAKFKNLIDKETYSTLLYIIIFILHFSYFI